MYKYINNREILNLSNNIKEIFKLKKVMIDKKYKKFIKYEMNLNEAINYYISISLISFNLNINQVMLTYFLNNKIINKEIYITILDEKYFKNDDWKICDLIYYKHVLKNIWDLFLIKNKSMKCYQKTWSELLVENDISYEERKLYAYVNELLWDYIFSINDTETIDDDEILSDYLEEDALEIRITNINIEDDILDYLENIFQYTTGYNDIEYNLEYTDKILSITLGENAIINDISIKTIIFIILILYRDLEIKKGIL